MHIKHQPAGGRPLRATRAAVRPQAVIAPFQKPAQEAAPSSSADGAQSAGWWAISGAQQLLGQIRMPWGWQNTPSSEEMRQALQEASRKQHQAHPTYPDITGYLSSRPDHDVRYLRRVCSLCSLTYHMDKLTPRALWARHRLELVTSSLACERLVYTHVRSMEEVADEADGMAVALPAALSESERGAPPLAPLASSSRSSSGGATSAAFSGAIDVVGAAAPGGAAASAAAARPASPVVGNIVPLAAARPAPRPASAGRELLALARVAPAARAPSLWGPADVVAAKLSEAAAMASAAALQPLASAAGSLYTSGSRLVSGALSSPAERAAAAAVAALAAAEASAASPAAAAAAAVVAAAAPPPLSAAAAPTAVARPGAPPAPLTDACPSEWFVADDAAAAVRYFVIQGSDSLDHWRTNLTFDPVVFEDARLGVKVHRGVYEAAEALYARYLPLVQEWVDSAPWAQVCFVGHSIGGSMATLLMLMYRLRGVLGPHHIAPVITFGAPAVFCDSGAGHCSCGGGAADCAVCGGGGAAAAAAFGPSASAPSAPPRAPGAEATAVAERGLLLGLGLRADHVRNVLMARDIVPRAFACDYSLVADLLRGWGSGFKSHCCLVRDGRKHLYCFVGQVLVLQPSGELRFARPEGPHPMLPPGAGLWLLQPPAGEGLAAEMATAARRSAALREGTAPPGSEPAATATEAVWALMDNPHPLDILADAGAYGNDGAISRFHNPDNYARALGRLLAERRDAAALALAAPPIVPALVARRGARLGTLTPAPTAPELARTLPPQPANSAS